jgi:uncharacterized membrane protein YoaK (UPF0700 family)
VVAFILYGGLFLLFGAFTLGAIWGVLQAAWVHEWKFAAAAVVVALLCAGGAFQMYEGSQGRSVSVDDPYEIRRR